MHIAPSAPLHLASQHFAVVCLASGPYKEPLNDGACAATARDEVSDCNQVRASERFARARLCFELSGSPICSSSPGFPTYATHTKFQQLKHRLCVLLNHAVPVMDHSMDSHKSYCIERKDYLFAPEDD